jgi:N6-adenosine-specific RNA methylase IME4
MTYQPHEYANLFPMMDDCSFASLVADIRENGLIEPIVLYDEQILDGRNRYKACLELGIEPRFERVNGNTKPLQYVISKNLQRRHLNESQRAVVAARLANMPNHRPNKSLNLDSYSMGQSAEILNVSRATVATIKAIEREAPELIEKIECGELTANRAWTEVQRREARRNLESVEIQQAKALEGVYDVIVIDPPWQMEKIEREVRPNQTEFEYPTMPLEEISRLEIPFANDCHVWLWTTQKFLPHAFGLFAAWDVKYVCTFGWHKNGGFQPIGLPQYNEEFILYGRVGSPVFVDTKDFKTCFNAPRGKHSEKPEEFYSVVRRVTAGRRLDMFSRRKIEGFDGWGKEAG